MFETLIRDFMRLTVGIVMFLVFVRISWFAILMATKPFRKVFIVRVALNTLHKANDMAISHITWKVQQAIVDYQDKLKSANEKQSEGQQPQQEKATPKKSAKSTRSSSKSTKTKSTSKKKSTTNSKVVNIKDYKKTEKVN